MAFWNPVEDNPYLGRGQSLKQKLLEALAVGGEFNSPFASGVFDFPAARGAISGLFPPSPPTQAPIPTQPLMPEDTGYDYDTSGVIPWSSGEWQPKAATEPYRSPLSKKRKPRRRNTRYPNL